MGWRNPPVAWSELERKLSDGRPAGADGGDSPAWSARRQGYRAPSSLRRRSPDPGMAYAELHCHSNFSFLDGASHPEELVEEAVRLGLSALALTDHDGLYGVVRFAEAARELSMPTVFGAELTLGGPGGGRSGMPDPAGHHLVVLAQGPEGYARLSRAISDAQMAGGAKGRPRTDLATLGTVAGTGGGGHWTVLTGCRKGAVPAALVAEGPAAAARELDALVAAFGRTSVMVEIWDHGDPLDSARNDALVEVAARAGVEVVATNNVHYGAPSRRRLATALAAVRSRRSLDEVDGWLPAAAGACLRSPAEQVRRLARYPGAVARAAELGLACAFDLALVAPRLPDFPVPPGHDEMSWLRELTEAGAADRYGPRGAERLAGAWAQIDHELEVIEALGFPGYFLVVHDIVGFCRRRGIYCQGRGSAANSAVCYALGITNADAVGLGLLFERFLSPERDGPPDIDVDIESERREEAIQYVYARYGRDRAAQVANVITYRPRSAVREMGKALGHPPGQVDAWSKQLDHTLPPPPSGSDGQNGTKSCRSDHQNGGPTGRSEIPEAVLSLAREVQHFPRHLGIHSGGMVICDRPVVEVCPVEWGRMADRSVLQWDKDDCAAVGLVKFDLLGLGMLSALHRCIDLIAAHHGVEVDLARLPQDPAVYEMLCRADSIGVFQVESRAQMATLPRLKPKVFYDLVVEVALIRPGPIQGDSVHPYLRRRNGTEAVTYLHPLLERSLAKTLGVPLFQEQLMQMAIDVAGFSAAEADQLRQAMGSKRSSERMERLRERLFAGMTERGITGEVAEVIYDKLAAFANFGFPESHSVSFAYLVYASAWCKLHYPAAFCASLLNAQPMGFWSPHTLVRDARRHGVVVHGPDVNASAAESTLEGDGGVALRLGLDQVRDVGDGVAEHIAAGRPYTSMDDLVRRTGTGLAALEALATAGAFGCFGLDRREALWAAGACAQARPGTLPGMVTGTESPALAAMSAPEETGADLWSTGISARAHPTEHIRSHLDALGVLTATALAGAEPGRRVLVGGVVTHRQRPATASGTVFVNLEDETGLVNVICSAGLWERYRPVATTAPALLVRGILERADGVVNVVADRLELLPLTAPGRSRDFR
ncbi:MAG TPA: error-prone DNA polymerase [Acidimicrobiales bacterium]|nr:error-prone DNA polymerase [Acidimicrobiales bacterium]